MNIVNNTILILLSMFGLTACVPIGYNSNSSNNASYEPVSKEVISIEKWYLVKLNGAPYQGQRITLEISSKNRVSGFSGCNRYFASVDPLRGNQIDFSHVGATRKLCADFTVNELEKRYLDILRSVTHYNKNNDQLVLNGNNGNLIFYKKSVR